MLKKFIPLILGTVRVGRQSEKVAPYMMTVLSARADATVQLVDVRDFAPRFTTPAKENNPATAPWQALAKRADAFIIVTPEYNHGYPGELKLLLDQDRENYVGKKVLLCGVSAGGLGGARVVENLLPVCRDCEMIVLRTSLYFSNVVDTFVLPLDELNKLYQDNINKAVDGLIK
jgi:NAD(P)H-dependent FMN reductase